MRNYHHKLSVGSNPINVV